MHMVESPTRSCPHNSSETLLRVHRGMRKRVYVDRMNRKYTCRCISRQSGNYRSAFLIPHASGTYCRVYWPDSIEQAGSEFAFKRLKTSLDCCLYSVNAFSVYRSATPHFKGRLSLQSRRLHLRLEAVHRLFWISLLSVPSCMKVYNETMESGSYQCLYPPQVKDVSGVG